MEAERQNGRNRKLQITRYTRDQQGQVTETIDALGRAEKVQYPDGREVSYTYGKAGERRSITYPDGKTVFYGYDEQLRLSELKEGDSIITYGYDPVGRLCEKQFPNGTKTTYRYDRKDQLTELLHQDQEGILDRYTYLYDLLGNKTGITKERRGLERESGQYRYGYDALGRLSEIQKDGEIQTRYGYDAFGNRTWKEESGEQTSYQYNALNQMVSERQGEIRKEYGYDKRGNLTAILENGAWKKQYVYGAMNRLEEAVDAAGKQARYQYNGLGHRVGKQEGVLPKEKLEKLDPQRRVGMEIGNSRQITYTLDLTRQYHNLLERTEESQSQRYFWDGNVAAYEENGERNYYLQDELGSPLRLEDSAGTIKESYGYEAFGEDLYQNQGKMQPFGYTGYQRDEIAGTYYAQAREYLAENGRFAGQDLIVGGIVGAVGGIVTQAVSDLFSGEISSFSTYLGAGIGGAAGGATLAGTGNLALANAVEGGVTGGVTTLGNGIEDMLSGEKEFSMDTITEITVDTLVSGTTQAASGTIIGKGLSKFTKFVKNPLKSLTNKAVDTTIDTTIGGIQKKLYKTLGLTGRNSWESLTKQVYTKLKRKTWSFNSLSLKTWGKMLGFETIDSAAEESINKLKDVLNGMIKYAEVEELTDEMLNTIKQWTKNISSEELKKMINCEI